MPESFRGLELLRFIGKSVYFVVSVDNYIPGTLVAQLGFAGSEMFDSVTPIRTSNPGRRARSPHGTVLLVEDHLDSREVLAVLFKSHGYTVLEANDGQEALELAADADLDLIVTDLGLPEMDGLEFVQRVRSLRSDQPDLKIALLTAYDPEDFLDSAFDAGCDLVLSKPIDLDKLEYLFSLFPQFDSQYGSSDLILTTDTLPKRNHALR